MLILKKVVEPMMNHLEIQSLRDMVQVIQEGDIEDVV